MSNGAVDVMFWLSSILRIAFRCLSASNAFYTDPTSATMSFLRVLFTPGGKVDGLAAFSIFHLLVCASRQEDHNLPCSVPKRSLHEWSSSLVIATIDPGTMVQIHGYHPRIPFRCHHGQYRVSKVAFTRNQEASVGRCIKNLSDFSVVTEDTVVHCCGDGLLSPGDLFTCCIIHDRKCLLFVPLSSKV